MRWVDGWVSAVPICAELVKRLAKAGKSMEEVVAGIKASWNRGYGPLHFAAAAGKVEICKFLIKDLKVNVDVPGAIGKILLFSTLVDRASPTGSQNRQLIWYDIEISKEEKS